MTRYRSQGIEHYHKAVLVLLDGRGGSFTLDGTKRIQEEFHELIKPLLKPEDYEPFKSSDSEERWETRFRLALWHLREDVGDGRVKHFPDTHTYEITARGRSYLKTTDFPLELLTEEVELLDTGEVSIRYIRPDGTIDCEFLGTSGRDLATDDF